MQEKVDKLEKLIKTYEEAALRKNLFKEIYSKRFNLIIHGIEEEKNVAWEGREKTERLLNEFFTEGLQVNPHEIGIADFHRLPQHPIYRDQKKVDRPIIIQLTTSTDKHKIMSSLKHLKSYNSNRKTKSLMARPVYITEHLPKQFLEQKKSLIPCFKEARAQKKKTSWGINNGEYCLYIKGKKICPL